MEGKNLKINFVFLVMILFALASSMSAQEANKLVLQTDDSSAASPGEPPHSFYAGMMYGSNMIYMGSNLSQNKPFYSGMFMYGYKNKFFLSASASHLSAFDTPVSFAAFSANFSHTFNSWFDITLSLSRYQVNKGLADTLFSSFTYGNITLGFDWRLLYTSVSAGSLFSETGSAYFNLKNSRYFETPSFMKDRAFLSFDPYVNLLFGTLTRTTTSEGTSIGVAPPFRPSRKPGQNPSGVTVTTYTGLMEIDFGLPIAFNTRKLTIEAEPGYVIPAYATSGEDVQTPKGFTLLISVYYRIF